MKWEEKKDMKRKLVLCMVLMFLEEQIQRL